MEPTPGPWSGNRVNRKDKRFGYSEREPHAVCAGAGQAETVSDGRKGTMDGGSAVVPVTHTSAHFGLSDGLCDFDTVHPRGG